MCCLYRVVRAEQQNRGGEEEKTEGGRNKQESHYCNSTVAVRMLHTIIVRTTVVSCHR